MNLDISKSLLFILLSFSVLWSTVGSIMCASQMLHCCEHLITENRINVVLSPSSHSQPASIRGDSSPSIVNTQVPWVNTLPHLYQLCCKQGLGERESVYISLTWRARGNFLSFPFSKRESMPDTLSLRSSSVLWGWSHT